MDAGLLELLGGVAEGLLVGVAAVRGSTVSASINAATPSSRTDTCDTSTTTVTVAIRTVEVMRTWTAAVAVSALAITLSACGSDDASDDAGDVASDVASDPTASASASETPLPGPSVSESTSSQPPVDPSVEPGDEPGLAIDITIDGDEISPSGERIEIGRDQEVQLTITSDRAGELHVHSKPEQFVEFEAGTSTHTLVIGAPGVVDVEEHETGHVVVQLEVG